jgi:hypothetical protein
MLQKRNVKTIGNAAFLRSKKSFPKSLIEIEEVKVTARNIIAIKFNRAIKRSFL